MKKAITLIGLLGFVSSIGYAQLSTGAGSSAVVPNTPTTNTNVGIGNTNPLVPLHLGTNTTSGILKVDGNFTLPPNELPGEVIFTDWDYRVGARSFGVDDNDLYLVTKAPMIVSTNRQETNDIRFMRRQRDPITPHLFTDFTSMIIKEHGEVGIGILKPWSQFQVMGSRNNDFVTFSNDHKKVQSAATLIFGGYSSAQPEANNPMLLQLYGNTQTATGTWGYDRFRVFNNGEVAIGHVDLKDGYKLFVEEGILTEKLKVAIRFTSNWSDYVFDPEYQLMPLKEVEEFVQKNKHLPNVPSAEEVVKNGIDVATMDAKLLEKIEELTLYMIQLKNENEKIKMENECISKRLLQLESSL